MLWSERARRMLNAIEELRINLNGRYHIEKLRASANGRSPSGGVWQQLEENLVAMERLLLEEERASLREESHVRR